MSTVRMQPSTGSPVTDRASAPTAPYAFGSLHAVVDYAHELADAQHKVLDRIANLGVRARLGDVYTRFVETLAVFERSLGGSSGTDGPRTDVRLREIVGIDGVGADIGLLAELDARAAVLLARIGEIRERSVPIEIADPLHALADLARDLRAEYDTLSM